MNWYELTNTDDIPTPALLIFPTRIGGNIDKMIAIAGGTARLRPHVKTHKLPQVVAMQIEKGINSFKCATIAEAEMLAMENAGDILLAMQPVGYHIDRLLSLIQKYPGSKFSCIVDSADVVKALADKADRLSITLPVWVDINNGMNRTGITPGDGALELYAYINGHPNLEANGLHIYDGHIRESNFKEREKICNRDFQPVVSLIKKIEGQGMPVRNIVAGGTPTFSIHAQREKVVLSPGTVLLWDQGYGDKFTDLDFSYAAVLMTSVVSRPQPDLLCLDLGHKAVASEMPGLRVTFLNLQLSSMVGHSEEHMVIKTEAAGLFKAGDVIYGIPTHICPTIDRHESVFVVEENQVIDEWPVISRKRKITI